MRIALVSDWTAPRYAIDSSEGAYKSFGATLRREGALTRVPASMTSSVLRLPRLLRGAALALARRPLVLFVHPWELVDLRAMPIRWDCRAGTGEHAVRSISGVLRDLRERGAHARVAG